MIDTLLLGTGNKAKISSYTKYFSGSNIALVTPKDIGIAQEPEETGETLEENATLKAKWYFEKSGLPTLADDGGFEIPALNNFPGVHSRRFAGRELTDEEIIAAILDKMKQLTGDERTARMHTVFALALRADKLFVMDGMVEGHVPEEPSKKLIPNFPYRSLLFVDSLGKWFCDITPEEEESLGYRKKAVEEIKQFIISNS